MSDDEQLPIEQVRQLYLQYTLDDVCSSLFAISAWLPNISAQIKHEFFVGVLCTLHPWEWSTITAAPRITSYAEFLNFSRALLAACPQFPMLEDYVPIPDWGEIRFQLGPRASSYLYSTSYPWTYDMLRSAELLYFENTRNHESPSDNDASRELRLLLSRQRSLIDHVTTQPRGEAIGALSPGQIAPPPIEFWQQVVEWLKIGNEVTATDLKIARPYLKPLGSVSKATMSSNAAFSAAAIDTTSIADCWFIEHDSRIFSVLPRHNLAAYFGRWQSPRRSPLSEDFESSQDVDRGDPSDVELRVSRFLYNRSRGAEFYRFVLPLDSNDNPLGPHYPAAIHCGRSLCIVAVLPPATGDSYQELLDIACQRCRLVLGALRERPRFHLLLDNHGIELGSDSLASPIDVRFLIVMPELPIRGKALRVPRDLPLHLFSLPEFLGIFDEIEMPAVPDFLHFYAEHRERLVPTAGALDVLGAYVNSQGTLTTGSTDFSAILLSVDTGDQLRFNSLSRFWKRFPRDGFVDDPRSWSIENDVATGTRIASRHEYFGPINTTVEACSVWASSPLGRFSKENALIADLLVQSFVDVLIQDADLIRNVEFFSQPRRVHVHFFPKSEVVNGEALEHVRSLITENQVWSLDGAWINATEYHVRVLFDDSAAKERFTDPIDRRAEVEVACVVLDHLATVFPDAAYQRIRSALQERVTGRPHYQLTVAERPACFPDHIDPVSPRESDRRRVARELSLAAQGHGVLPGTYSGMPGRDILNRLRGLLVERIDALVDTLEYHAAIYYLISRIDALSHEQYVASTRFEDARRLAVTYDIATEHSRKRDRHEECYRSYRYLIEKVVSRMPSGAGRLDKDGFRKLAAIVEKLLALYQESDLLHYQLEDGVVVVGAEHEVKARFGAKIEERSHALSMLRSKLAIGDVGKSEDAVHVPDLTKEYVSALDAVFQAELRFRFTALIGVLDALTQWSSVKGESLRPFYSESLSETAATCSTALDDVGPEECSRAIEYLILEKDEVLRVQGMSGSAFDVPVWEQKKRPARYAIRPILRLGEKIVWGPYSARAARTTWVGFLSAGTLPHESYGQSIRDVVENQKRRVERMLVEKCATIVQRFTSRVKCNAELHRLDKPGQHPLELGDYDVVAYVDNANLLLNIECKDLSQPFCLRDARTLREKIFESQAGGLSSVSKVERREKYLKERGTGIVQALGWGQVERLPGVASVWVSRGLFMWSMFPSSETSVVFTIPELLDDVIRNLVTKLLGATGAVQVAPGPA